MYVLNITALYLIHTKQYSVFFKLKICKWCCDIQFAYVCIHQSKHLKESDFWLAVGVFPGPTSPSISAYKERDPKQRWDELIFLSAIFWDWNSFLAALFIAVARSKITALNRSYRCCHILTKTWVISSLVIFISIKKRFERIHNFFSSGTNLYVLLRSDS